MTWHLNCPACGTNWPDDAPRWRCSCGSVLDAVQQRPALDGMQLRALWDERLGSRLAIDQSGVWRFREVVLPVPVDQIVTMPEGRTNLYCSARVARWAGVDSVLLKHEGENPTGSFKDRGMTVAATMARRSGATAMACASTGNTSASMAAYAARADLEALVFIPDGAVAWGKLAQAMAYGARTLQISGDFDDAMRLVEEIAVERGIYLANSINAFRIEGQKAIGLELLQDLGWSVPDWIVVPGGNLGNNAAIFKGLQELKDLGGLPRLPRIAVVQAAGAAPLYHAWKAGADHVTPVTAQTLATAIRIGDPVSWRRSLRAIRETNGVVESVTDQEILEAKAVVDRAGIGAEPASCASVAGLRKLVAAGTIRAGETVVCILTGHVLKDPGTVVDYHTGKIGGPHAPLANPPIRVAATRDAILEALDS